MQDGRCVHALASCTESPFVLQQKNAQVISLRTERVPIQPSFAHQGLIVCFAPFFFIFQSSCAVLIKGCHRLSVSAVGIAVVRALTCRARREDSIRGATTEPLHRWSCVVFCSVRRERFL